jgi:hypothetical protein
MTQEDKELLLKDICARLPYGVMVREDTVLYDDKNTTSYRIKRFSYVLLGKGFSRIKGFNHDYEYIYIPYLFPLSSMTEEHSIYMEKNKLIIASSETEVIMNPDGYDFLNKNHYDYRGLIEKGLALDATGLDLY